MRFSIEPIAPFPSIWRVTIMRTDGREIRLDVSETDVRALTSGTLQIETHDNADLTVVLLFEEATQ